MTKSKTPTPTPKTPTPIEFPHGCITADALHSLADALERLEKWHNALYGRPSDSPCLRRIEADGDCVHAYVSVGPAVGGDWERLTLSRHGWNIRGFEMSSKGGR